MTYSISEVSGRTGLSIYTLRYYDREGLLPFVDRNSSGARVFKGSDFGWLKTITCLKDTGMSLKEIRAFIHLCMQGDATLEERLKIIQAHQENFSREMAKMEQYRKTIANKVWYYTTAVQAGTESIHGQNWENNLPCDQTEQPGEGEKTR